MQKASCLCSKQSLFSTVAKMSKLNWVIQGGRPLPFGTPDAAANTEHQYVAHNGATHSPREGESILVQEAWRCSGYQHPLWLACIQILLHGAQAVDLLHAPCRSKSQERKLRSLDSMSDSLDSADLDSSISASMLDAELNGGPAATRSAVELSLDEDKVCSWLASMCQRPV